MPKDTETESGKKLISLDEILALAQIKVPLTEITQFVRRSRWYLGRQSATLEFMVCGYTDVDGVDPSVLHVIAKDDDGGVWNLPLIIAYESLDGTLIAEVPRPGSSSCFIYDATSLRVGQKALIGDVGKSKVEPKVSSKSFEQSNTSFIYDDLYFKLYRRLVPHKNREVKILEGLSSVTEGEVPQVIKVGERCGYSTHLILESLDGQDLYGVIKALLMHGDVERVKKHLSNLGVLLASIHRSLRGLFGYESITTDQLYLRAYKRVSERIATLEPSYSSTDYNSSQIDAIAASLSAYIERSQRGEDSKRGRTSASTQIQVIHGDLHLGQILICGDRQTLIDFEGEVLGEKDDWFKAKEYDLAGVARSIHYASFESRYLLTEAGEMVVSELEDAFLGAYLSDQSTYLDSSVTAFDRDLYEVLKLEKAVYELEYELRAQRGLLAIPASFLLGRRGEQGDE